MSNLQKIAARHHFIFLLAEVFAFLFSGLNGSGKSNILDSVCFVLGISKLDAIRAIRFQCIWIHCFFRTTANSFCEKVPRNMHYLSTLFTEILYKWVPHLKSEKYHLQEIFWNLKNEKKCLNFRNLTDLIFKQGQAGITKATVSITFDNSDKQSPIGYSNCNEIVVRRQVGVIFINL